MGAPGAKAAEGSGKEAPASGGGLDWLTQVAQPESDAGPIAAGISRESGSPHTDASICRSADVRRFEQIK